MGNVIELTIGIILLVTKCEIGVVQSSLVGAILSNLLLVLGGQSSLVFVFSLLLADFLAD